MTKLQQGNQNTTIKSWLLQSSRDFLQAKIPSPHLDAELIMRHILKKDSTWLVAHDDKIIPKEDLQKLEFCKLQRLARTPIAYIVGKKEFYGRDFYVTKDTLIPRPESEDILEILKNINSQKPIDSLIDVGTGSGVLGITAKKEFKIPEVILIDVSIKTLLVAEKNAKNLKTKVILKNSSLLRDFNDISGIVVANLPYVDKSWETSPETEHEPSLALFANQNGLELIDTLIQQTKTKMTEGDLILESDLRQHQEIILKAEKAGFSHIQTIGLCQHFSK